MYISIYICLTINRSPSFACFQKVIVSMIMLKNKMLSVSPQTMHVFFTSHVNYLHKIFTLYALANCIFHHKNDYHYVLH